MQIFVKVKPNARKNEVQRVDSRHYVILTTSAPEKGKANEDVIVLLAKFLRIGKSKLQIIKGATSHNKIIKIIE